MARCKEIVYRSYGSIRGCGFSIDTSGKTREEAVDKAKRRFKEEGVKYLSTSEFCKLNHYVAGILDYIICIA